MLPFQKIIALLIRTMAKPMLTMAKKKQQQKKVTYFNTFFIYFGRRYHRAESWVNMKLIKSSKDKHIKQLKQQIALEKGIQGLYQIFFYMIVIGLPLHEMYKASISTHSKQEKLNNQIEVLENNLNQISDKLDQLVVKKVHLPLFSVPNLKTISSFNYTQKQQNKQADSYQKQSKQTKSLDSDKITQQKKQIFQDSKQQYASKLEASEIVAQTMQQQMQDSILQAISDFIQQVVGEAIQSI